MVEQLKAAVAGKDRKATVQVETAPGAFHRLPILVPVRAGDVADVCAEIKRPDPVVTALSRGTKGQRDRLVYLQITDLWHLIEKAEEQNGEPVPRGSDVARRPAP